MRIDRLIIVILIVALASCKTAKPTVTVPMYEEDLRVHRPLVAQQEPLEEVKVEQAVELSGHLKAELDAISAMIVQENAKPRTEQGYTIQIYSGASREEATLALGKVRVSYPEIESSLTYFQPDFKVKVGQFTDRILAYETFEKLRVEFVDALLIPEKIKINNE
jgi:hypothetical protein